MVVSNIFGFFTPKIGEDEPTLGVKFPIISGAETAPVEVEDENRSRKPTKGGLF